mgnify:CR=1 FL=1
MALKVVRAAEPVGLAALLACEDADCIGEVFGLIIVDNYRHEADKRRFMTIEWPCHRNGSRFAQANRNVSCGSTRTVKEYQGFHWPAARTRGVHAVFGSKQLFRKPANAASNQQVLRCQAPCKVRPAPSHAVVQMRVTRAHCQAMVGSTTRPYLQGPAWELPA